MFILQLSGIHRHLRFYKIRKKIIIIQTRSFLKLVGFTEYLKNYNKNIVPRTSHLPAGAPVAQWVKRWPTNLADRVRSSLGAKSS